MRQPLRARRATVRGAGWIGLAAAAGLIGAVAVGTVGAAPEADPQGLRPGGATTVDAAGRNAFSFSSANLSDEEKRRFVIGNSFFRRNWVEAPSSTAARDGLGPHFIARSCGGCHVQDGRGAPPDFTKGLNDSEPVALLLRLSVPGKDAHGGPMHEPVYGDQFSNAAVQGVKPEGRIVMRRQAVQGRFADGTRYTLHKPLYSFADLGYGPMRKDTMVSPRIAPQLIGMGLLEAIADADIEGNARDQAAQPGPIKGQVNRVWDAFAQQTLLGRFGWKANVATLAHQTGGAFVGDIGITSSRFPSETCSQTQIDCVGAPRGAKGEGPEIDDELFANVVFYQAALAPAMRRQADAPVVQQGAKLFQRAQCATCHRPSYVTTGATLAERFPRFTSKAFEGQRIWPYTDLLLHDMGDGLADGRPDYLANGRQWRTPPLWGIGQIREVNGHQRLLHDGRADGVLEAVLWHDGEARASRGAVLQFTQAERDALVKFVESL